MVPGIIFFLATDGATPTLGFNITSHNCGDNTYTPLGAGLDDQSLSTQ
jgi:hypothetical protein